MKNQKGNTKTLIIIAIFVLLAIVGNLFYFIYWQANKEDRGDLISFEEELQKDIEIIEEKIIEEPGPDFEYKDFDSMSSIVPCYLNKNPQELIYFPEGSLRAFFDHISSDSEIKNLSCTMYDFEEIDDYAASLFQTDVDRDGLSLYLENIYSTDDEKEDTDDDGFSDLVEINNGYNPNDANDGPRGIGLFDYNNEDLVDDNSDEADGSDTEEDVDTEEEGGDGGTTDLPQEIQINQPEDCLLLEDAEINQCLNNFVESMASLEPCVLSVDFDRCVADANLFSYISNNQECFVYEDYMNITNFDKCLSVRSTIEDNANLCFSLKEASALNCINSLVVSNDNIDLCAYIYFLQASINSTDGWQQHRACINQIYNNEPEVEQGAFSGCENIDLEANNAALLYKMMCFVNLAVAYDNIDYCSNAAMVSGSMNQAIMNDCTSKLEQ